MKKAAAKKKSGTPSAAKPRIPRSDFRNRAAEARKRLGVKKQDVQALSRITPLLRQAGVSIARVIEILEADGSPDAQIFLECYRKISKSDLQYLSLEEICVAAGLATRRLWEVLAGAALQQGRETVQLMVAVAQPRIVETTIRAASEISPVLNNEGEVIGYRYGDIKAQELISKATGFLPSPRGSSIVFNLGKHSEEDEEEDDDDEDMTNGLPGMDDFVLDVHKALEPAKLLSAQISSARVPENAPELDFEELPAGQLKESECSPNR